MKRASASGRRPGAAAKTPWIAAISRSTGISRMQRWWCEAAVRLVARPAGEFARGFDHARKRVERRPVPGARRPEDADRRRVRGGGDVQEPGIVGNREVGSRERQDGVAQVGAGEVADVGGLGRDDLGRERGFAGAAQNPHARSLGREPARQFGEIVRRPALRQVRPRPAQRRRSARPPSARPVRCRHAATLAAPGPPVAAPARLAAARRLSAARATPQRSIMRGSARSPQRRSLMRPRRASPAKPVRSGIPASQGAKRGLPRARHDQDLAVALARAAFAPSR